MGFWSNLLSWPQTASGASDYVPAESISNNEESTWVNPATGLPMIGGISGVDAQGNPFGVDLSSHHETTDFYSNDTGFDDDWMTTSFIDDDSHHFDSGSSLDDPFDPFNDDSFITSSFDDDW